MPEYNPVIDGDYYHNDDIVREPGLFRGLEVTVVTVDYEAVAKRNIGYIQENIAARRKREGLTPVVQ